MSPHRLEDPVLLRSVLHTIPDAIIIHDEYTVLYANPAALKLLKAPSSTGLLGKPVTDLVHPDDREGMSEQLRLILDNDLSIDGLVEKLQTSDGEVVYAQVNGSLVEGEDGARAIMVVARPMS